MKIMIHSNAPWTTTGYGQQTALWAPLLASLGHEIIISTFYGLQGAPLNWEGFLVLPASQHHHGSDILNERVKREQVDLLLTLMDIWVLEPQPLASLNVAHWMPVDCMPLSTMDQMCLKVSGATPIAMSRFGEEGLRRAGFDPLYVPHGIDTNLFTRSPERVALRAEMGYTDEHFVIGMNAANKDAVRKGMFEQLQAFQLLHQKHPDARLMIHALITESGAIDLGPIIKDLGIAKAVRFVDQYSYLTGTVKPEHMAAWYSCLDLYSGCSYAEGFGLPLVEAQSCGVPVVVTDFSSMPEVCGTGWKVKGEPFWNPAHQARWLKPSVPGIFRAYEQAYQRGAAYKKKQAQARESALQYDAQRVLAEHWKPVMQELEARLPGAA
jgi:glycosyltransferase involved in cell wall biosynthesis